MFKLWVFFLLILVGFLLLLIFSSINTIFFVFFIIELVWIIFYIIPMYISVYLNTSQLTSLGLLFLLFGAVEVIISTIFLFFNKNDLI